jgi:hypothetical protein
VRGRHGSLVHLLWVVKEMPEGNEDIELLIGVYSTDSEAKAAIERVRNKRGFAQYQDRFRSKYPRNRDHWTDGFVIECTQLGFERYLVSSTVRFGISLRPISLIKTLKNALVGVC